MPAAEQQAPAADVTVVVTQFGSGIDIAHDYLPLTRWHRHHVVVEIGNDPNGASDDEEDDQHAERQGIPARAVKTASSITRGFISAKNLDKRVFSAAIERSTAMFGQPMTEGSRRREERTAEISIAILLSATDWSGRGRSPRRRGR